ncbi:hypothetical protein SLA2020_478790 [Shorea laevis]
MAEGASRSTFICLSSDEEDELESEGEVDSDSDDEESSDRGFFSEEAEDDESDDSDENEDDDDDESLCNRVICLLEEGGDLEALSLKECKAYLRKHGLRIAGTKAVCIQRIVEYWRIKDGNGEALYPRSSFFINCTGDVCKGDVVLFTQKVYEKFDKVKRHGRSLGRRTVAGRVVKESYGAAKQQHTFTVEVLWSKGTKKLPPLFPMLVKGRNLYKLRTFRQRWKNEAERRKVLAEKHRRGTAARLAKAMRKTRKPSANVGATHHKHIHHSRPSQMMKTTENERGKYVNTHRKTSTHGRVKSGVHHLCNYGVRQVNMKHNGSSILNRFSSYDMGSTSTMGFNQHNWQRNNNFS